MDQQRKVFGTGAGEPSRLLFDECAGGLIEFRFHIQALDGHDFTLADCTTK